MRSLVLAILVFVCLAPGGSASPATEECDDLEVYRDEVLEASIPRDYADALETWFATDDITDLSDIMVLADISTGLFEYSDALYEADWGEIPQVAGPLHVAYTDTLYVQSNYVWAYESDGDAGITRWEALYEASLDAVAATHETGEEICGDLWTDVFDEDDWWVS